MAKKITSNRITPASAAAVANVVAASDKKGPGRPAHVVLTTQLAFVSPKGASFRMDKYEGGKPPAGTPASDSPLLNTYLNREALIAAGLPKGKMPTLVEVTFRIKESADEPVSE